MGLVWTAVVAALALMLVIDFFLGEPYRKVDVAFLAIGALALLNAAHNEVRGRYPARRRIIIRSEEPDRFRNETILLVSIGSFFVAMGGILQLWGWYSLIAG